MKRTLTLIFALLVLSLAGMVQSQTNGGFETGDFKGWKADKNWIIADKSAPYYLGWNSRYFAWSGGGGEPSLGVLQSEPFKLVKSGVRLMVAGWSSIHGTGQPRIWNYVTLNLEDGTELDRVYTPDTTNFVYSYLDGHTAKGKMVYIKAVDDAEMATYSMICIDNVTQADPPADSLKKVTRGATAGSIVLQNAQLRLEFDPKNGSLTRLSNQKGLELIMEPRLGGSYRFALPIPGKEPWQTLEANWIFGAQQKLSSYRQDGNTLTMRWDGPLKNYLGERFDVSVRQTVELTPSGVQFDMWVDNRSIYTVGESYYPLFGGLQGLGSTRQQLKNTELVRPAAGDGMSTSKVFNVFNNMAPFGDQGPEQFFNIPQDQPQAWAALSNATLAQNVFIGAKMVDKRPYTLRMELFPGSSGVTREDGNWPRPSELKGVPAGVELSFVQQANHPAGQVYHAPSVYVQFISGNRDALKQITVGR